MWIIVYYLISSEIDNLMDWIFGAWWNPSFEILEFSSLIEKEADTCTLRAAWTAKDVYVLVYMYWMIVKMPNVMNLL